jgi:hypothetical protein
MAISFYEFAESIIRILRHVVAGRYCRDVDRLPAAYALNLWGGVFFPSKLSFRAPRSGMPTCLTLIASWLPTRSGELFNCK